MKLEITVNEVTEIFKGIQQRPEQLFEMIRLDIKEVVGDYLTAMIISVRLIKNSHVRKQILTDN